MRPFAFIALSLLAVVFSAPAAEPPAEAAWWRQAAAHVPQAGDGLRWIVERKVKGRGRQEPPC
jgi:hypothetical protein